MQLHLNEETDLHYVNLILIKDDVLAPGKKYGYQGKVGHVLLCCFQNQLTIFVGSEVAQKLIKEVACPNHDEVTFWGSFEHPNHVNPLLLRLYLDHENIFYI